MLESDLQGGSGHSEGEKAGYMCMFGKLEQLHWTVEGEAEERMEVCCSLPFSLFVSPLLCVCVWTCAKGHMEKCCVTFPRET